MDRTERLHDEVTTTTPPDHIPSILKKILSTKRERLLAARSRIPLEEIRSRALDAPLPRDFAGALSTPGVRIIAEMKRRSPSKGVIREDFDVLSLAEAYRRGGADAYSILTEEDHFDGNLEFVRRVREVSPLPILRKDFLFDPYQIYEARAAGADAVLLIVVCLSPAALEDLLGLSGELGLSVLTEVHTDGELDTALQVEAPIVGINNRDLHTFKVDLGTAVRMAARVPAGRLLVGESGIHGPEDIQRLRAAGIRAFLIGEHFMKSPDIAAAVSRLKEA